MQTGKLIERVFLTDMSADSRDARRQRRLLEGSKAGREHALRATRGSETESSDSSGDGDVELAVPTHVAAGEEGEAEAEADYGPEIAQRMAQRLQELQAAGLRPAEDASEVGTTPQARTAQACAGACAGDGASEHLCGHSWGNPSAAMLSAPTRRGAPSARRTKVAVLIAVTACLLLALLTNWLVRKHLLSIKIRYPGGLRHA